MEDRWGHDGYKELEKKEVRGERSRDRSRSPRERSRRRSRSRSPHSSKHSRRSSSRSPRRDKKRSRRHSRSPYSDEGKSDDERRSDSKRHRHEKTDSESRRESHSRDRDSRSKDRDSHRDRDRDRSRDRDRDRSRDRDRDRSRDRDRESRRDRGGDDKSKSSSAPERSDYKYAPSSAPPPPPPRASQSSGYSNGYSNGHTNGGASSYNGSEVEGRYGLSTEQEEALLKPSTAPKIDFAQYDEIPVETSGRDCPSAISVFTDVDLGKVVMDNIKAVGYDRPTPVQKNSIPIVLAGRDLMACAQTGSGKTAAFLLPLIAKLLHSPPPPADRFSRKAFPLALVLAPTRELACQIQDECKKFAFRTGLKSAVVYGGSPIGYQLRTLEQGCDILVATPGRLVDILDRDKVSLAQIKFLVLDEADRMLDMGFEPQIRKIVEQRDMTRRGLRRTLMFSATFPKEIQQLASQFLEDYIFLAVGRVGSTTDLVTQHFVKCDEYDKSNALLKLVRESQGLTLIFVETKKQAENLGNLLMSKGFPATSIHGDRAQKDRTAAIRTFSTGKTPFLVATNVAARGLDIENIAHVINYDMPGDIDDYVHRIGRTGRAGKPGMSTSLITPGNANIIPKLIEILEEAGQELPRWLDEMKFDRTFKKPRNFGGRGPKFGGTDFRRDGGGFNKFNSGPRPPPSFGGDGRGYPSSGGAPYNQYPPRPQGYGNPPPPSGPAPSDRPYAPPSSSYGPPAPGYSSSSYSQPGYQGGGAPQNYGPAPPTSHRGAYAYKPY